MKAYQSMKHPKKVTNKLVNTIIRSCIDNYDDMADGQESALTTIAGISDKDLEKLQGSKDPKEQAFYNTIGLHYNSINEQLFENQQLLDIDSLDQIDFSGQEDTLAQRLLLLGWIEDESDMKRNFLKYMDEKEFMLFWYFINALDVYRLGLSYMEMLKEQRPDHCKIPTDRYIDYLDSSLEELRTPIQEVFDEVIEGKD